MQIVSGRQGVLATAIRAVVAGGVIGALSVAFAISFMAIIFSGPLAPFLGQGIGLALAGAAIMAVVGAWTYRHGSTLCQPQDTIAILLAAAAARIAATPEGLSPAQLGPTVAMLCMVSTLAAGIVALICGQMRIGQAARYIPFPVLGGFLAASGYVLLIGAIGMATGRHVDLWSLPQILAPEMLIRWLPWIAVAAALTAALRIVRHDMALPAAVLIILAGFYLFLALAGVPLQTAMDAGMLLGPFPDGKSLLPDIPAIIGTAHWPTVLAQAPTILTVAVLCVIGTLLNTSGLELALGRRSDLNHDLRATGIVNIAASVAGSPGGYPMFGETMLAARLGLRGILPGLSVGLLCAGVAVFGGQALSLLPTGLFVALIGYLGFDLLVTWLWVELRRLPLRDIGIVLLILAVAAVAGIMEAIVAGLVAAAVIFVLTYARLDPVRRRTTAALRRSITERPAAELDWLAQQGDGVRIWELTGYLFFGTAHALSERVGKMLDEGALREVVLDFAHVPGIDSSARRTLDNIRLRCEAADVRLTLTGMRPAVAALWRNPLPQPTPAYARLDDVLPQIEDRLLAGRAAADAALPGLMEELRRDAPGADLSAHLREVTLGAGQVLIAQGEVQHEVFLLEAGAMRAEIRAPDGGTIVVARFLPGALIGEIAFYASLPRTAAVIADSDARLICIDAPAVTAGDAALAAAFHRAIARRLALRLARTTMLIRDLTT